jgi:hypothetical protein
MENFGRPLLHAKLRLVQQVAMAFAKSVVHLHHNGAQRAILSVAIPEADGLEGVAQDTGIAVQPDFTIGRIGESAFGCIGVVAGATVPMPSSPAVLSSQANAPPRSGPRPSPWSASKKLKGAKRL